MATGVGALTRPPPRLLHWRARRSGRTTKDAPPAQLAAAIRRAMAGERVVDPALAASALTEGESPLTAREEEVLRLAAAGLGTAEMAERLHLSGGTVRNYLSEAIQKLGARNSIDAARRAEQRGWL